VPAKEAAEPASKREKIIRKHFGKVEFTGLKMALSCP